MATEAERELLRMARVHRFHRRGWGAFWAEHADEIRAACPDPRERMDLIHRLQSAILCGVSPEKVEELPT
jgi:hypothetical protein